MINFLAKWGKPEFLDMNSQRETRRYIMNVIIKWMGIFFGVLFLICPSVARSYSITFTDLNIKVIAYPDSPPLVMNDILFGITNSTGQTWTDFHMSVTNPEGGTPPYFIPSNGNGLSDGATYNGPGSYSLSSLPLYPGVTDVIDILGLNIPNAGTLNFNIDIAFGEGGWHLRGNPTVDSGPPLGSVPEPESLALVVLALAGLGFTRRKAKQA